MGMSEFYGAGDDAESLQVLNRALDLGCNFWDTADMYGAGKNEELLARVLKDRRDEVFLCTKFGVVREVVPGSQSARFAGIKGDSAYVRQACENSLQRLGVKTIDLYYQHRVDTNTYVSSAIILLFPIPHEGRDMD